MSDTLRDHAGASRTSLQTGAGTTSADYADDYTAEERQDYWDAINNELDALAESDTATNWYGTNTDPSGQLESIPVGDPGAGSTSVGDYFNSTHAADQYYATAADAYNDVYNEITGAGQTSGVDAVNHTSAGGFDFTGRDLELVEGDGIALLGAKDMLESADLWDKYKGKTAADVAKELYEKILAAKAIADHRYNNELPPDGSNEDIKGIVGDKRGKEGRAALDRADKCAEATRTGNQADIDKYCGPEAKKKAAAAKPEKKTTSLAFREQCFLLSKVKEIADLKAFDNIGEPDNEDSPKIPKRWPYVPSRLHSAGTNASIMVDGDPFTFINDLALPLGTGEMLRLPSSEISKIQPLIRFFKVTKDKLGKEVLTPITFETDSREVETLFKEKKQRNVGVGLQDFQVKFQGTNPFAAKKDLTAKATIFATTFADLLRPIRTSSGISWRYVDLALKTNAVTSPNGTEAQDQGVKLDDMNDLNFSIRAVVGTHPLGPNSPTSLKKNFVTLEMTPTIHSFEFADDGSVKFVINYKPFINENFNTLSYDVFSDPQNSSFLMANRIITKSIITECDMSTAAQFKRTQIEKIKEFRADSLKYIVEQSRLQWCMKYLYIPNDLLKTINREGPLFDFDNLKKAKTKVMTKKGIKLSKKILETATDKGKSKSTSAVDTSTLSTNQNELPFVYLSDLVDVVMSLIDLKLSPSAFERDLKYLQSSTAGMTPKGFSWDASHVISEITALRNKYRDEYENYKKLRIVLGPIELFNPIDPLDSSHVNLGDLPISLSYLTEFLTSETLQKGLYNFPLDQFMNKLINKLVSSFLNDDTCFGNSVKQRTFLKRTSFVGYQSKAETKKFKQSIDPLTIQASSAGILKAQQDRLFLGKNSPMPLPLLDVVGGSYEGTATAMNNWSQHLYSVFYTAKTTPIGTYTGNRTDDEARGVYHYAVGRDSGIIQEVKLVRDKRKGIAEARFAQDGFNGLKQLREVYHVEVKTYANLSVYPGMKIYVDPKGWVPSADLNEEIMQALGPGSDLTEFGIGGYYDVIEVEHFFGPGRYETSFRAMWVADAGKPIKKPTPTSEDPSAAEKEQAAKCKVYSAGAPGKKKSARAAVDGRDRLTIAESRERTLNAASKARLAKLAAYDAANPIGNPLPEANPANLFESDSEGKSRQY